MIKVLISFYLLMNWLTKFNNIANDQFLNTFNISQQTTSCTNDSRSRRVYPKVASRRIPRGRMSRIHGPWRVLDRSGKQFWVSLGFCFFKRHVSQLSGKPNFLISYTVKLGYNEQIFSFKWSFYYINQPGYNEPRL